MVVLGDALVEMAKMEEGSIDLVLSDLPSGETRAKFDKRPNLTSLFQHVWRVLRPNGTAVFMASSFGFASDLRMASLDNFKEDLICHKSMATGHLNANHRALRAHEFILVFSRGGGVYNPQMMTGASPIHACRRLAHSENYGKLSKITRSRAGATDRFPTSVVVVRSVGTTSPERLHPQQKPLDLMVYLVKTYSNPGDLVLDPYAGSGVVEKACELAGRRCLSFDDDPRFGV